MSLRETRQAVLGALHNWQFLREQTLTVLCGLSAGGVHKALGELKEDGYAIDLGVMSVQRIHKLAGRWFCPSERSLKRDYPDLRRHAPAVEKVPAAGRPDRSFRTNQDYIIPAHQAWVSVVIEWICRQLQGDWRLSSEHYLRSKLGWYNRLPPSWHPNPTRTMVPDAFYRNMGTGYRSFRLEVQLEVGYSRTRFSQNLSMVHDGVPVLYVTRDDADAERLSGKLVGMPMVQVIRMEDDEGLRRFVENLAPLSAAPSGVTY
jgi:hypothetical protein